MPPAHAIFTMPIATDDGRGNTLLAVKAVPGARRDEIAGPLGERLKVRTSVPPEGGRANAAICALIAEKLGVKPRDVMLHAGHASAEKTVLIAGLDARAVTERLGLAV